MGRTHELYRRLVANTARRRAYRTTARDTMTMTTNARPAGACWTTYTTVSGSELQCTEPAGHEGDHYAGGPWALARLALVREHAAGRHARWTARDLACPVCEHAAAAPVCRSCELLPAAQRMPATRIIGGVWYCFAHGLDIYCD